MSIRGLLTHGLLDSPSEMLTLGLDSAEVTAPDTFGVRTMAKLRIPSTLATLREPKTMAALQEPSTLASIAEDN